MTGHDGIMGFGGGLMWLFWVVVLVGMIWLIKAILNSDVKTGKTVHKQSPLELLKNRYAQGEIDDEEYHRRRKELEKD